MPTRAPSACRRPGCPGLVRNGVCSRCGPVRKQAAAEHDERRGTATARGYDARWQRLREMHLSGEPLCRRCTAQGRTTLAVLVDHIVPIRDGGDALDDDNLQSLCRRCHDAKTAEDLAHRRQAARPG